jgi:predicted type IV restriction endonuclease
MSTIPAKILPRLTAGIKKFQAVLNTAKAKDINESDTVVIVTDMLSEIFGFDKYSEITSEFSIKKTWCDLAIKIEDKVKFLIEVKAIGLAPKEDHIKQAVDYGSNQGVDWVILTSGIRWRVYKIIYGRPISHDLVYEFDFLTLNGKKESDLCMLYYVSKESLTKSVLEEYHIQKQSLSKFFIGQILLGDMVLEAIKKSIKKVTPGAKLELEDIKEVLANEVVKREIVEGEKADEAKKKITKALKALEGKKTVPASEKPSDNS